MKKYLIFLFSIQVLFAQDKLPDFNILQEKGVKKITVKNHQLTSIHTQTNAVRKEEIRDPSGEMVYDYFISRTGVLDSIYIQYVGGEIGKWIYRYDEQENLVGFTKMTHEGILIAEEKIETLASGYQRYRNWQQRGILRESLINPAGRIVFRRSISGRDSSFYRYDEEREVITRNSYMYGKPNYEMRYEWLMGEQGPDSMFFSFIQQAPGEGRMPSHSNRCKVLEDGSLEILPHHMDMYELSKIRFDERLSLFEGMDSKMGEAFSGDTLAKKSDVLEMLEYSGWKRRYYYSYKYTYWKKGER